MQRNRSAHTACCGPIIIYRLRVRGGGEGRGFGGGGHMVLRDHEGRTSRLYQSRWNGELQKTDHQWGGISRILESSTGSGKFCCDKIKIHGLLTQPPPPPPSGINGDWFLETLANVNEKNKFCTCYRAFHDTQSDDSKHQNYKVLHF